MKLKNKFLKNKKPDFPSLFPIITKVSAKTLSSTLVSVQPLGAPIGQLTYIDYQYNSFIIPEEYLYKLDECETIFDSLLIGQVKPEFKEIVDDLIKENGNPFLEAQKNFKI